MKSDPIEIFIEAFVARLTARAQGFETSLGELAKARAAVLALRDGERKYREAVERAFALHACANATGRGN